MVLRTVLLYFSFLLLLSPKSTSATITPTLTPYNVTFTDGLLDGPIYFGCTIGLSNPIVTTIIADWLWGMEAALKEINKKGGGGLLAIKKIKWECLDDNYDTNKAAVLFDQIMKNNAWAVLGTVGTGIAYKEVSMLPAYQQGTVPIPFLSPLTGGTSLYRPFQRNVVLVRASYEDGVAGLVNFSVKRFQISRFSIFYQNDAFGLSGYIGIQTALGRLGFKLESSGTFERANPVLGPGLQNITKGQPEAIVLMMTGAVAGNFINTYRSNPSLFRKDLIVLLVSVASDIRIYVKQNETFENCYMTQVVPLIEDPKFSKIVGEYTASLREYNSSLSPTAGGLEGYVNFRLIARILERMGNNSLTSLNAFRTDLLNSVYENPITKISSLSVGPYGDDCSVSGTFQCCNGGLRRVFVSTINRDGTFHYLPDGEQGWEGSCGSALRDSKPPITFGQTINAAQHKSITDGIRLAFEQENANGGLNGRPYSVLSYDDGGKVEKMRANVLELEEEDEVLALIGSVGDEESLMIANLTSSLHVPLLGPVSGHPSLRNIFGTVGHHATYYDEVAAMVQYCDQNYIYSLTVIYSTDEIGASSVSKVKSAIQVKNQQQKKALFSMEQFQLTNTNGDQVLSQAINKGEKEGIQGVLLLGKSRLLIDMGKNISSSTRFPAKFLFQSCLFTSDLQATSLLFPDAIVVGSIPLIPSLPQQTISSVIASNGTIPILSPNSLFDSFYHAWLSQFSVGGGGGAYRPFDQHHFEGYIIGSAVISFVQRVSGEISRKNILEAIYAVSNFDVNGFKLGPFYDCSAPNCHCNIGRRDLTFWKFNFQGVLVPISEPSGYSISTCGFQFPPEENFVKAGFLYPKRALDLGYSFTVDQARVRVTERLNNKVDTDFRQERNTSASLNSAIQEFLANNITIIFATSIVQETFMREISLRYPKIQFVQVNGKQVQNPPNIVSVIPKIWQVQYLAGMVAGLMTKTKKIGYVMGDRSLAHIFNSFWLGVKAVSNKTQIILVSITEDSSQEVQLGEGAAQTLINLGADVIGYQVDGDSIPKYVANNMNSKKLVGSIGWNNDMRSFIGESVLISSYYDFTNDFEWILSNFVISTTPLLPNSVYFTGIENQTVVSSFFSGLVPAEVRSVILEEKQLLMSGKEIFCGPIQNSKGMQIVDQNQCLNPSEIVQMRDLFDVNVNDLGEYKVPPPTYDYLQAGDAVSIVLMVLTAILMFSAIVIGVLVILKRHQPIIKAATLQFCLVIIVGIFVGLSSIFPWLVKPTNSACKVRAWLLILGYDMLCHPLYLKTWRLKQIFANVEKMSSRGPISNIKMGIYLVVVLSYNVVVLIVWTAVDPLEVTTSNSLLSCGSNNIWLWLGLIIGFELITMLWGLTLAFSIRKISARFNESKPIVISIYNTSVVAVVIIPVLALFKTSALGQALLVTIAIWILNAVPLYSLFLPKLAYAKRESQSNSGGGPTSATSAAVSAASGNH